MILWIIGRFADDVEDRIFKAVKQVLKNTGVKIGYFK